MSSSRWNEWIPWYYWLKKRVFCIEIMLSMIVFPGHPEMAIVVYKTEYLNFLTDEKLGWYCITWTWHKVMVRITNTLWNFTDSFQSFQKESKRLGLYIRVFVCIQVGHTNLQSWQTESCFAWKWLLLRCVAWLCYWIRGYFFVENLTEITLWPQSNS